MKITNYEYYPAEQNKRKCSSFVFWIKKDYYPEMTMWLVKNVGPRDTLWSQHSAYTGLSEQMRWTQEFHLEILFELETDALAFKLAWT